MIIMKFSKFSDLTKDLKRKKLTLLILILKIKPQSSSID